MRVRVGAVQYGMTPRACPDFQKASTPSTPEDPECAIRIIRIGRANHQWADLGRIAEVRSPMANRFAPIL